MTTHEQVQVNNAALDLREDLTIEFWVNPDRMTDSWTPLVYKGGDVDGQRGYSVWYNSNGYIHLRSEEHTSELQSQMRISYAVFCLKKKNHNQMRTSKNIRPPPPAYQNRYQRTPKRARATL